MRTILIIALFFQLQLANAQQMQTSYFVDRSLSQIASERKAAYKKTTSVAPSGLTTVEIIQIKNSQLISRESYIAQEPIGKWISTDDMGRNRELDYDFQLGYTEGLCKTDTAAYIDFKKVRVYPFADSDSLGYLAPKFATGEKSISAFVNRRIVYPREAIAQERSGTVQVEFIIGQNGQIEALAVRKGINVLLDKEAMRIARELKFLNGASIAGRKKKVCAIVPITFVVAD